MLKLKIVSFLDKCFIDQTPDDFRELKKLRMYKNERAHFQVITYDGEESWQANHLYRLNISGALAEFSAVRTVENIINYCPTFCTPEYSRETEPGLLRAEPGLYPDILCPTTRRGCVPVINRQLHSSYITVEGDLTAGTYPTDIFLTDDDGNVLAEAHIDIDVLDICLPEQDTIVTDWFYTDCLADYYNTEPFSLRHFEICGNFISTYAKNGFNMIITPLFSLPLDTYIGGERTTCQLVGVTLQNGSYSFDFTLLDKWLDICQSRGIKYFEMCHLFTQWGAYHTPKIMVTENGKYIRKFGWDTVAESGEYPRFLASFLPALTSHFEALGLKDRVYFHISDEPNEEQSEQYAKVVSVVKPLLEGWKIMDAISDVKYYKDGLCQVPVPISSSIEDFMKEDIDERWVYYCCGPWAGGYSNRFVSMSQSRVRSIGMQMYKYGIKGYLHWGFNYYNNQYSYDHINPFINPAAGYWGHTGDAMVVYPSQDGTPLESIRLVALSKAIDDIRVMKLAESLYSRDTVIEECEKIVGIIDFKHSVDDGEIMEKMRQRLDDLIAEKISK